MTNKEISNKNPEKELSLENTNAKDKTSEINTKKIIQIQQRRNQVTLLKIFLIRFSMILLQEKNP